MEDEQTRYAHPEGHTMSANTEADIDALKAEMRKLRDDFGKIGELLKATAKHGSADAADAIRERAERHWNDAKNTAQTVFKEMESRPVQSAITIFVVGIILGLLFGRR